jgi:glucose-1-phosphate thymidylyltransferase
VEEIAYHNRWIDKVALLKLAKDLAKSGYGEYLRRVAEEDLP